MITLFLVIDLLGLPLSNIQYPVLSPDGSKIAFSCFGDIWTVDREGGRARRLTVSNGYESVSKWSPDGKWIAFESDEWGSDDIYVLALSESLPPKRLTYYSTYERLLGWTPDSKKVLFGSRRNTLLGSIYSVSLAGETPKRFLDFNLISSDFISLDSLLYSRGVSRWWRKKYRGPANFDIWIKKLPDGESKRLTNFEGRDAYPMYSPATGKIYFLSNRGPNNINNIWRMNVDGSNPEQITHLKEEIYFPSISEDGRFIAFTSMGSLYTLDFKEKGVEKVPVVLSLAFKDPREDYQEFNKDVSEFAISPDEKEIAFIVHGEILVGELKDLREIDNVRQITHTPAPEKDISWHPEKEQLVFSSLCDGDFDIYTIEPLKEERFYKDLSFEIRRILNTDKTEYRPTYSPDGEKISYIEGHGQLWVMDKDGKGCKALTEESDILWVDWAPDSRWITFSRTVLGWREDVFVVLVNAKTEPINISNNPNDDYKPMWSSDGRRIAFASRDNVGNLWIKYVFLYKEDEDKDREFWEENLDSLKTPEEIQIDFDDIDNRTHTVTKIRAGYNYIAESPKGDRFAFHAENLNSDDVWTVDWFGDELLQLTKSNVDPKEIFVTKDAMNVYYLSEEGEIGVVSVQSPVPRILSFGIKMLIDKGREREETFREAWWIIQDGFYDSDFHGIDWKKMYDKYINLALISRSKRAFHSVIDMMLGELNASHLGIWKLDRDREITGRIGIIPDPEYHGDGIKIKDIIPGSPAAQEDVSLKKGEIIIAINNKKIGRENFYKMLRETANKEILVTINKKEIKVKPTTPAKIGELIWKEWVGKNQDWVKHESNSRIGYLYIASMGDFNLEKFEGDLYKQMDKDGLVIDIRYNGGGHIHDELLNILRRTTYGYSKERDDKYKTSTSLFKWDKPTVLLINEYCYSDAEIFPMGFKELKLGTVVGKPTFGAVIGTNNFTLMDGSTFRQPSTGWYRVSGNNLENNPVYPDVLVEDPPEQEGRVPCNQLKEALRILMQE